MFDRHTTAAILCALVLGGMTPAAQSPEVAATITTTLEGPTADAGGNIYFVDVSGSRILRMGTDGAVSTFRQPSNRASGLVFDAQFRLIAAERGDTTTKTPGRITRTDLETGRVEVLADSFEGVSFQEGAGFGTPNDVTFDGRGRIYFTAGPGGSRTAGVFRIDQDGKLTRIITPTVVDNPNGLIVSPDDRILYIIEANQSQGGSRRIQAFALSPDGAASNPRVFHDFYPGRSGDGMSVDSEGNLWLAAGLNQSRGTSETLDTKAGIHVFSPAGVLIQHVPIPQDILTNTAFGGPDLRTLYVTAGHRLFRISTKIAGTRR
jgi:gluconolactonase